TVIQLQIQSATSIAIDNGGANAVLKMSATLAAKQMQLISSSLCWISAITAFTPLAFGGINMRPVASVANNGFELQYSYGFSGPCDIAVSRWSQPVLAFNTRFRIVLISVSPSLRYPAYSVSHANKDPVRIANALVRNVTVP